jgi:hypothetical protein
MVFLCKPAIYEIEWSDVGRPKTATEMKRIEIAVNPELLDLFDAWWKLNHFPTRNEALRQILREKVNRES